MEASFEIFPKNEELKKIIRVPSVLAVTPCQKSIDSTFHSNIQAKTVITYTHQAGNAKYAETKTNLG